MSISKWAAGHSYGPVLSQQELYMLEQPIEINPILENKHDFHLVFNLPTGQTGGYLADSRDANLPFTAKDEPATLPRVEKLYIITNSSPWCTTVKNEKGVTMADVCTAIWKDYTENYVTDGEFSTLHPRVQEQVKRTAVNNQAAHAQAAGGGGGGWGGYYPTAAPARYKRVDWLRDKVWFEGLKRSDEYTRNRLGYTASNIFEMLLTG